MVGWSSDNHSKALKTFLRSCSKIRVKPSIKGLGVEGFDGFVKSYQRACDAAQMLNTEMSDTASRIFFENRFDDFGP